MRKILAVVALVLIAALVVGCGTKVAPKDTTTTTAVEGESEISDDVAEVDTIESELTDAEAEEDLDAIGDVFSDW